MVENSNQPIKGDRALGDGDEDRLGFRDVAKRIATSLVNRASEDGLVVGLEGAWGSGKSSLLYLISDELGKLPAGAERTVIQFRPWLIGNRDALIASLFGELVAQLDQVALKAGDATRISVSKAKEASEAFRRFVNGLSKAGAAIEVVGEASGFGPVRWIGKGISALGKWSDGKAATPPLSSLKAKLSDTLCELGHRLIVMIDDVDRLEPSEVIEILRLVRSVVDLPNVIYLLSYDSEILAHSIEKAAGVRSGHAYLEKIVQLTVMVPRPEPLQLRQWFSDELHRIASTKNGEELSRLRSVIDYEGGRQLRTPRSVIRALDAVRFFWPPLNEAEADLADLVWLQLIKDGNPGLYRWIEEYCATAAAISLGIARVENAEKAHQLAAVIASVPAGHFDDLMYRHMFVDQLPGMAVDHAVNGPLFRLYENVREELRDAAVRKRRLGSPDHYRLYFALAGPSHALTQEDFAAVWAAAVTGPGPLGEALLRLQGNATNSLTKADLLLERVRGGAFEILTDPQIENMLLALANFMDEAYRQSRFDRFWVNTLWERAKRLIPLLLSRLDSERRARIIAAMFAEGAAIGWLTTVFRHEFFAHGRFTPDRARSEGEWLLTDPEFDQVIALMLGRYRAMTAAEVLTSLDPVDLLFAWRQGGDEEGPRRLIGANIPSDEGLVETLEALTSQIESSDRGRYDVLKRDVLTPFLDYESARQRIGTLTASGVLAARAAKLQDAFEAAQDARE